MKFYLKVINPGIAAVVFVLCLWAACGDSGEFNLSAIFKDGLNLYFLAKGVFTASSMLMLGRVVLEIINRSDSKGHCRTRGETVASLSFGGFLVISFLSLFIKSL